MSDIKFRVWDKTAGDDCDGAMVEWDPYRMGVYMNNSDEYILMQFTGIVDKNGREIYVGDVVIVENQFYKTDPNRIPEFTRMAVSRLMNFFMYLGATDNVGQPWNFEIVGNIYENPGLLD